MRHHVLKHELEFSSPVYKVMHVSVLQGFLEFGFCVPLLGSYPEGLDSKL